MFKIKSRIINAISINCKSHPIEFSFRLTIRKLSSMHQRWEKQTHR